MESNNIDNVLNDIKSSEGDFVFDEIKIKNDLQSNSSAYSNITIKILSIIGGILATLSFIGFLALVKLFESESAILIFGFLFIIAALAINKGAHNIILDTSTIALYIIGYILLAYGIGKGSHSHNSVLIFFIIISFAATAVSNNFMIIFLSVLIFNGSIIGFIFENKTYDFIQLPIIYFGSVLTYITFSESKIISYSPKFNQLFKPIQAGFFISFIVGLILIAHNGRFSIHYNNLWILSLCIGGAVFILASKIIKSLNVKNSQSVILMYLFALFFLLPTFYAPFISGSIFILLLSYYFGYKSEIALSIILLVYSITQYYYDLDLTLLVKSAILFLCGILLMGTWLFFNKQLKNDEKI